MRDSFDAADGRQKYFERALELGGDGKLKVPRSLPECCQLVAKAGKFPNQGVVDRCAPRVKGRAERRLTDVAGYRSPALGRAKRDRGQFT
jgi:hypothetical protein